jgi:hypothetical protein
MSKRDIYAIVKETNRGDLGQQLQMCVRGVIQNILQVLPAYPR